MSRRPDIELLEVGLISSSLLFDILKGCMPFVMLQPDLGIVGVMQRMSAKDERLQDRQWRGLEDSVQYVSYQKTMSIRRKFC